MISVIIPCYNRAKTVLPAIKSVLNQTIQEIEVIIIDDGSTDDTKKVIESINDKRVKYYYQENAGACAARNHGIKVSKGKYIAFHDSDDIWHENKLEKQLKILEEKNADIVFCKLQKIKDGEIIEYKPEVAKEGFLNPIVNLFGIGTQTIIGKKEIFDEFKFDKDFPRFQEFELLYRITKKYNIYCIDEALVDYIISDDSISNNSEKLYKACFLFKEKHPEVIYDFPIMAEKMAHYLISYANIEKNKKNDDWNKYIELAKQYSKTIRIKIKMFLTKLNLYYIFFNK